MAFDFHPMGEVLIIDDDSTILAVVEGALHAAGHQAVPSNDPEKALELLGTQSFDAVVLDVVMPNLSGFDVLRTIRGKPQLRATPVLMLSSRGEAEDRVRGLREGADDYVVKPFDLDVLIARVERLMARDTPDASTLKGHLESFSAADLLQSLCRLRKTGVLHIADGAKETSVYFEEGEILSAHQGQLQGEEALITVLEKDSGAFRFAPGASPEHPPTAPLQLNGIFMDAAWLEDELARRAQLLPAPEAALRLVRTLPPFPDDLAPLNLPYEEVGQLLADQQPIKCRALLEQQISAPRKISLVIALLIEAGVVTIDQSSTTETPTNDLQPLSRGFAAPLREALGKLRGDESLEHPHDNLHVMVFYGPSQWEKLLSLLNSVPEELISADRGRLLEQLRIRNRGSIRFKDDSKTQILVHLHPLVTTRKRRDLVFSFVAGVVIWLEQADNLDVLGDLAQILATRACPVGIVAPPAAMTAAVQQSLKQVARLEMTAQEPHDFADLLNAIPAGP